MRFISKFISWSATILLAIILLLKCSGNGHIFKALRSTYMAGLKEPTINDYKIFDNRIIKHGEQMGIPHSLSFREYKIDGAILKDIASYDPIGFMVMYNEEINNHIYSISPNPAYDIININSGNFSISAFE